MRIIRSEAAIVAALADTARASRLAPVDPVIIGRARAAIRRHRAKRSAIALAAAVTACTMLFMLMGG